MAKNSIASGNNQSQYQFESSSWIRMIEFLTQENMHMMNRLSEVIDNIHGGDNLAMAEHYQNQFIIKDDVYDHMLHDLRRLQGGLRDYPIRNGINKEMQQLHKNLKEQLEFIERDHILLRQDYNTYLCSLDD